MFEVIELGNLRTVSSKSATNHVYVIDVSGSMYGSLPTMRTHLKNIISIVTSPEDTFSIIYFSGRGQCGIVAEGVEVSNRASVDSLHAAIDRWIRPIGLTGFAEPLELAIKMTESLPSDKFNNFVMLTDGYDNQSNRDDILKSASRLPDHFNSTSFIEYGWYCDRNLLAKMAEMSSGIHMFAEGLEDYKTAFDEAIVDAIREPRIDVPVNKKAKHAIYIKDGHIIIAEPKDGIVSVPESVERVHSIVPKDVLQKQLSEDHLYLIMFYAVKTGNSKIVWNCLEALGDVALIDQYTNAFSKQEITDFQQTVETCVLDKNMRFLKGKDVNHTPKPNALTVLDVLRILDDPEETVRVVTDSPHFRYTRTSRGLEKPEEDLPRFVPTPGQNAKVTGLVYNSTRPNVSLQTLMNGTVEVPANDFKVGLVPSHIFRNYTIIRDGILNVKALPVVISNDMISMIREMAEDADVIQVISDAYDGKYVVLNLDHLPIINRNMVVDVDLDTFLTTIHNLEVYRGMLKGEKHFYNPKADNAAKLADEYGPEAAAWLSSIGVRDYGFSPSGATKAPTDTYMSNEVEYKVKGLSSLPSVNAVLKKIKEDKKLTLSEALVYEGIVAAEGQPQEEVKNLVKATNEAVRTLNFQLSRMIYAMVIGKSWFKGVEDYSITEEMTFKAGGGEYTVPAKIDLVQKEIKI